MSGGGGKDLATRGLDLIAKGLTEALGELRELGMAGEAGAGRGFGDVALSGLELGHEGLTGEFSSFCERWEWGVRALVAEGNAFAEKAGLAAGTYYETDQYVKGAFKVAVNASVGNPYASEEEVQKMGWGEIAASGGGTDYSGESFRQAWANSEQGWKDAARDALTSRSSVVPGVGPADVAGAVGVSRERYDQMLDEAFGPSAEARAEAAGQQGQEG
ncbi:hypothetical protein [Streptomyces rubradiris]|uniref:Uncharacterized protein n=2 Tax=Streptomyces rubradiris TaxID=285531 RepID=A0ABQ3RIR0_STRRR|nr:hypothetical protein [Streptomyces rubradiris]GHH21814.1 hypothetical protein GCM10018792_56920 [Streptomyces rubradiris]GHI55652.1 hypothetical protein Srubr_54980 [Streptomyces rubradiris]